MKRIRMKADREVGTTKYVAGQTYSVGVKLHSRWVADGSAEYVGAEEEVPAPAPERKPRKRREAPVGEQTDGGPEPGLADGDAGHVQ